MSRSHKELREQSLQLLWSLRQILTTSERLEASRRDGHDVLTDAADVANLESFSLNARVFVEFFWPAQGRTGRWAEDAVASDWIADGSWDAGQVPLELREVRAKV